jgi:hypothetical protein
MNRIPFHITTVLLGTALGLSGCSSDTEGDTGTTTVSATDDASDASESADDTSDSDATDATDATDTSAGDGDGDAGDGDTGDGDGDTAQLRVLHLGVDAPAVDVYVDGGATPAVEALAFEQGTGYLDVPAGEHTVDLVAAGGDPATPAASFTTPALEGGVAYSGVAHDYLANLGLLAVVDDANDIDSGNIRIQVIHAAPDVGEVDIWEITGDPIPLLENVPYGAAGTLDVPNGALEIGIDVDDDATPDVTFSVPALGADQMVNVYAVNESGGAPVFLLAHLPDGSTARVDAN